MIRIAISMPELNGRIAAVNRWANNVDRLRQLNIAAGHHVEQDSNLWSEVKVIFTERQNEKCCYCERRPGDYGIDWDVEHYRPKGRVRIWPPPVSFAFRFKDKTPRTDAGYYLLAYDPLNYLAACKRCNSLFKKSYFPVAGRRRMKTTDPQAVAAEEPLLINPLHDDDDPEELIEFLGPTPQPRFKDGIRFKRALVTIELLGLARDDLIRDRCPVIFNLWNAWITGNTRLLDLLCRGDMEHSNCARSFRRVCESDPDYAKAIFESAIIMLERRRR